MSITSSFCNFPSIPYIMIYSSFCLISVYHLFCTFISWKFHSHFCSCHSLQVNHTGLLLLKDNMWQVEERQVSALMCHKRSHLPISLPFKPLFNLISIHIHTRSHIYSHTHTCIRCATTSNQSRLLTPAWRCPWLPFLYFPLALALLLSLPPGRSMGLLLLLPLLQLSLNVVYHCWMM